MTETALGRRRLGRGLEALLGPTREEAEREGSLVELPVREIRPNPFQPRQDVDAASLEELKSSIQQAGLLQPVVVRTAAGGGYELIAGERRLRACQALGWERVPAVKREVDDRTVLTLALIENLQRDDLSPVDEARGYDRLIAEFNLTQQDVADAVGRDRSTVANALRLLKLPEAVLAMLHGGDLTVGHARAVPADGDLDSRQYRVPVWAFEAGKWGALVVALLVVFFFAFAGPIGRAAARVPGLERQVTRLREENSQVQQLAAALNRAEQNYQSLRQLLGVRAPPERTSAKVGVELLRAVAVRARSPAASLRYESGPSQPSHWPLDVGGFVTRGQVRAGDAAESHPGVDIAVPEGTPVRAAGGGIVSAAGVDPAYGLFVLLRHAQGNETMYGHASRLLVREGDSVQAGQVIALSGTSGRSTAPHLHFEIRRDGRSLDPLTVVKQEN